MQTVLRQASKSAGILAVFAIVGTALLAATYLATKDAIAETEKQAKLALISQILPKDLYDNDLIRDVGELPAAAELGNKDATPVYRASLGGQPSATVIEAIAPDGYSGKIKLLIALKANGELSGVRVVAHAETPGLGDYIEIAKSPWIKVFDGLSLAKYQDKDWKVKKDGGKFEHNTGATVSPRAIVKAVHKALKYAEANRETLFPTVKLAGEGASAQTIPKEQAK